MFSHYLSTALRHFRRHKVTTTLNVLSLAIGLTAFLAVFGIVTYLEASDSQWPRAERIYAITQTNLDARERAAAVWDATTLGYVLAAAAASPQVWLTPLAICCIAAVAAGAYPAFVLSSVRPAQIVRGAGSRARKRRAPQVLVAIQFTAATFLVIALIVMHSHSTAAINQTVYRWITRDGRPATRPLQIAGIVATQPLQLIGFGASAGLYLHAPASAAQPVIRIDRSRVPEALRHIDRTWERLAPHIALKRQFGDERMNQTLWLVSLVGRVVGGIAAFALLIAVLGLIGMSLHYVGRRTHEIGVRKTLGASVHQVLVTLLRDLSKPVIVANLIAWPLAFAAMRLYLNIFTERSALSPMPFVLALVGTLSIAWSAVAIQATRAARVKPVTVLRYE